jgi:hypothetical protein
MLIECLKPAGDGATGRVFGALTGNAVTKACNRLISEFGAPPFTWQLLRSTASTYLTNAPGIFGAVTAFGSAKQLGHSVTVAEGHYAGLTRVRPDGAGELRCTFANHSCRRRQ